MNSSDLTIDQELQQRIHIFGDEIGRKMHAINRAEKIAAIEQKLASKPQKQSPEQLEKLKVRGSCFTIW